MRHSAIILALALCGGPAAAQNANDRGAPPPGSLSQKLDDSNGVVKPPAGVDPNMKTHPPAKSGARMPVIKPSLEKDGHKIVPK